MVFSAEENDLTILSWNIKMLTAPYGWLHNRVERAENIVHTLNTAENYDVILFQEVFSGRIRKLMYKGLQSIYPYQLIPKDQSCIGKSNSGLWVVSKSPIMLIDEITFSNQKNWDALSSKGAKLYSVVQDEQKFHIINTHLQADYKTKYNKIRTQQYTEIYEKLILPNDKSEIPLILCGDLNISKPGKLKIMLEKLHLMNGPLSGDLQFSSTGKYQQLLDYILVKSDNFQFESIERKILDISKNPKSLSDHYPIQGIFKWK
jgi:phospholipase C